MTKRNFKVYADIGDSSTRLLRTLSVLDTGAGPNFIRKNAPPSGDLTPISYGPLPYIADANSNPIQVKGITRLLVRLKIRAYWVEFIVCDSLAAPIILGCEFFEKHVEAIPPRQRLLELEDGTTIPIFRKPLGRVRKAPPLPVAQECEEGVIRSDHNAKVAKATEIPALSQAFVSVTSLRDGYSIVEPVGKLYDDHQLLTSNGVANVESNNPFRILLANLGRSPKTLAKNQVMATLLSNPTIAVPTHVLLADVVDEGKETPSGTCAGTEERGSNNNTTFRFKTDNTDNSHKLGTTISAKSASPPSLDEIDVGHVPPTHREKLRSLLQEISTMWDGSPGEVNTTEHHIDLVKSARLIASHPYRAAPRPREAEQAEAQRMLDADVIEPAQSAWALPVVLAPKPDGSLRFCVDY